eukprot:6122736-Prymnesium_polylepis.1
MGIEAIAFVGMGAFAQRLDRTRRVDVSQRGRSPERSSQPALPPSPPPPSPPPSPHGHLHDAASTPPVAPVDGPGLHPERIAVHARQPPAAQKVVQRRLAGAALAREGQPVEAAAHPGRRRLGRRAAGLSVAHGAAERRAAQGGAARDGRAHGDADEHDEGDARKGGAARKAARHPGQGGERGGQGGARAKAELEVLRKEEEAKKEAAKPRVRRRLPAAEASDVAGSGEEGFSDGMRNNANNFTAHDTNEDRALSFDEFCALVRERETGEHTEEELRRRFEEMDRNRNAKIDEGECLI